MYLPFSSLQPTVFSSKSRLHKKDENVQTKPIDLHTVKVCFNKILLLDLDKLKTSINCICVYSLFSKKKQKSGTRDLNKNIWCVKIIKVKIIPHYITIIYVKIKSKVKITFFRLVFTKIRLVHFSL